MEWIGSDTALSRTGDKQILRKFIHWILNVTQEVQQLGLEAWFGKGQHFIYYTCSYIYQTDFRKLQTYHMKMSQ